MQERATAQERSARQQATEAAALRRAADMANRRLAALVEENRTHKALAQVGGNVVHVRPGLCKNRILHDRGRELTCL